MVKSNFLVYHRQYFLYQRRGTNNSPNYFKRGTRCFQDDLKGMVYLNGLLHERKVFKEKIQEAVNELNEPHTIRKLYNEFNVRGKRWEIYIQKCKTQYFVIKFCNQELIQNSTGWFYTIPCITENNSTPLSNYLFCSQ